MEGGLFSEWDNTGGTEGRFVLDQDIVYTCMRLSNKK